MPRSEDYLDSLLDSIKDGNKEKQNDRGPSNGSSESSYLRDFEKDAFGDMSSDDEADFLTDFENDIGFNIREGSRGFDGDEPVIPGDDDLQNEIQRVLDNADAAPAPSKAGKSITDSLDDILRDIEESDEDFSSKDDIDLEIESAKSSASRSDEDDILEGLTDIMESEGSDDEVLEDTPEPAAAPEAPAPAPVEAEDEEELLSDIDSEDEEPAIPAPEPSEAEDASGEGESTEAAEGDGSDKGSVSEEEIMDIGNLLDSIDEEGNLTEAEQGAPVTELRDEPAAATEEGEESEGEGEGKQSFIQKLLGKLFKKKKGDEEEASEEGKAEGEAVVAAASGAAEEEEEPVDKKAAKAAEKERKKKEKEEAKKKAAAEKAEKAKQPKEKKEKKKKKREPDTSPKIPIIVIVPFVVLAISIFILWNVLKDNISYSNMIRGAKSLYDNEHYLESYRAIDGAELTEEDMLFGQKAQLLGTLELRLVQYQVYTESKNRSHLNALDALVKGVVFYEDHKQEAESIAIKDPFDKLGKSLEEALAIYELTPAEADELMDIRERDEYTVRLYFILEELGLWSLEE